MWMFLPMNSTLHTIRCQFNQAMVTQFGEHLAGTDPLLVPASHPKFGDYQSNIALSLAKQLGHPPRTIAEQLVHQLTVDGELAKICEPPAIAGPGFINFRLHTPYLEQQLQAIQAHPRLGIPLPSHPQPIIVDFSSPNIAKEMHVGHLRSTIIGDSIARILEFQGHHVIRRNHVGDWGTQFGMLITYLREVCPQALSTADAIDLGNLVTFYQQAKQRFDTDEAFQHTARTEVVKLQSGDPHSRIAWQLLCEQSRREFQLIYDWLDICIEERGESFYNPFLPNVVAELEGAGLIVKDAGALCVFVDGFTNKDGDPLPLIVQKSDGGFNYATTDLAAIHYRIQTEGATRIIYVTDAGQSHHFAHIFAVAREVGWLNDSIQVVHVPFGLVQGEDGKKLKTRSGETIRLKDLLDEAIARARTDLITRLKAEEREETDEFIQVVSRSIGLAAVKYADLSQNRTSNYIFSFDKMLDLRGNTAPYLLYAYARIQGISRKGNIDFTRLPNGIQIHLQHESELVLTRHLLQLDEILSEVERELLPNRLCHYLFELSQKFNQFYDKDRGCPVLTAEEPLRTSRLIICNLTARTLQLGLSLLGIPVLQRM